MLVFDKSEIGKNLFNYRKKIGLTQIEVAEKANLSDRTYADIERGSVNMRVDTLLKICDVLKITPNDILTEDIVSEDFEEAIFDNLKHLPPREKESVLRIIEILLNNK